MSIYSGPNTTQNNLLVHLDPSSPRSYPGSGSTIFDISGNGHHGILSAGVNVVQTGPIRVLNFTSGSVITNSSLGSVSFPISISVWINQTVLQSVVSRWVSINNVEAFVIRQAFNTSQVHSYFFDPTNNLRQVLSASGTIMINEWALYSSTYDGSTLRIYKNTSQIASGNFNQVLKSGTNYTIASDWGEPFVGNMGEIRVYNRALLPQEIINNFNATRGRYGI